MRRRRAALKPSEDGSKRRKRREKDENVKDTERGGNAEIQKPRAWGGGVHPLLIDHVLEKVFQHIICPKSGSALQAKNVQNVRLVCRQWKDTATRVFRRYGPLFKFPEEKMQNFLDDMNSSDLIPFRRYTFNASFFVSENQQLMKDFMRICGRDAVELRFCWDHFCTMKFNRRTFPDLNLKGLKTLAFNYRLNTFFLKRVSTSEIVTLMELPSSSIMEVLFSAAENLQEFQFTFTSNSLGQWTQAMTRRFAECISKQIPKNVKVLHLEMPLSDFHLNALAERELRLEEFQFDSQCGASSEGMRKFFVKQATTLKVLKILNGSRNLSASVSLDFPRFDELRHLELEGITIQNFSFPDAFPKLVSLNIAEWKTGSTYVELLDRCTNNCISLKEMHLPYRFAHAPLVKKSALCFPNITKLHIYPSLDISETLQEVFVYFHDIEELYITFPGYDEISPRDCPAIMKHRNFDNMSFSFRNFQNRPSLLNLTKLKKLVLMNSSCDILTDFSVRFIFLKMASLKELHTNQCRISTENMDLLRKKLSLKLIDH